MAEPVIPVSLILALLPPSIERGGGGGVVGEAAAASAHGQIPSQVLTPGGVWRCFGACRVKAANDQNMMVIGY